MRSASNGKPAANAGRLDASSSGTPVRYRWGRRLWGGGSRRRQSLRNTVLSGRRACNNCGSIYGRKGTLVRLVYLSTALLWWLLAGLIRFRQKGTVVLCYHGVTASQRTAFAWQMRQLVGRCVDLSDPARPPRPRRGRYHVCVTFDDALACLLENAVPVLRELGIPAVVFAIAENLGARPRWEIPPGHPDADETVMSAEQVRMLAEGGPCRIGSHTLTHVHLAAVPPDEAMRQLVGSKAALEQLLGTQVLDLALPYGSYNQAVLDAAAQAGYRRVYTLDPRPCPPGQAEGTISRFLLSPDVWRIEFRLTCAGAYSYLYGWRRFVRRVRSWLPS